jgi:hypothetical protein
MKRFLTILTCILALSMLGAARDIQGPLKGMFNYGHPFTDTVTPTAPATSIPQFSGKGTANATSSSAAPGMFNSSASGDLAIVLLEYANDVEPTMTGSWAEVPVCTTPGTGTGCPDGAECTALKAYYQIIDQSSPARTVTANGNHTYYVMIGFKGGSFNAADPFEDNCSTVDISTPTTAMTMPAFVTENNNSLVVTVWAVGQDGNTLDWASDPDNTTATNPYTRAVPGASENFSQVKSTADGGGLTYQFTVVPVAGSTGVSTSTSAYTRQYAGFSFGINGVTP